MEAMNVKCWIGEMREWFYNGRKEGRENIYKRQPKITYKNSSAPYFIILNLTIVGAFN